MADSTAHSELVQYVRATMGVIGMRIYLKELGLGHLVDAPTPIFTDAQVVLDGTHCRRVSRAAKWMATRYAMVRQAEDDGSTVAMKCASELNDADILKATHGFRFHPRPGQRSRPRHGDPQVKEKKRTGEYWVQASA